MNFSLIKFCRSCKGKDLTSLFSLGNFKFSGIFPQSRGQKIPSGILKLIKCNFCSLVQLDRNFNPKLMYGNNYGYRSGLNSSMVSHLKLKYEKLINISDLNKQDIVIDIGSNDGTFLNFFNKKYNLIGVDPTIEKFKENYKKHIVTVSNFFSYDALKKILRKKKAKLITSIAMFYDLPDTIKFATDVYDSLDDEGVWHFEQSYLPKMLTMMSYDTICHEHIQYYSLRSILYILDIVNFKIISLETNNINGGSISITVAKKKSRFKESKKKILYFLKKEHKQKIYDVKTYLNFYRKIKLHKKKLNKVVKNILKKKKIIAGYGASTKGNILLQFCNLRAKKIKFILEINEDKFNKYTPGTNIKIVSENFLKKNKVDYFLVLPWHFEKSILKKRKKFGKNIKYIFPLPKLKIV